MTAGAIAAEVLTSRASASAPLQPANCASPRDVRAQRRGAFASHADTVLVFVVSLSCYCFQLGNSPLAGTEGNRAITAHQMVQTGHWLVPHLFDQVYLKKPPLHYWVLAAAEVVARSANEWVWRLPSAIGTAALAAILCAVSNRWFGRPAGLAAGFAHLALIAVWEQSRSADIDALNSLAAVGAACGLIDLHVGPSGRRWSVALATGLAIGAALLLKGPAGFTVVAGALLGPPLFIRAWLGLRRPGAWIALLLGATLFGAYALAAYLRLHADQAMPDASGLAEAADKSNIFRRPITLVKALALPPTLFAYALPVSLAIPFVLHPSIWNAQDDDFRRRARALIGTLAVGCCVAVLTGMTNPRYAYVLLPLTCPLAGALAAAWKRSALPADVTAMLARAAEASGAILIVACVAIAAVALMKGDQKPLLIFSALAAVVIGSLALRRMARGRWKPAFTGLVAVVVLTSVPFAVLNNADHNRRSAFVAAQRLTKIVPPGALVTAGMLPVDHPELFYYAQVRVESHLKQFARPVEFPGERWVLLDDEEYPAWKAAAPPGRMRDVVELWPEHKSAFLARYGFGNDAPPARINDARTISRP